MSNPVLDVLTDWQSDADAADTNLPTSATAIGATTAGDLAGELRRVKSELRGESIIKSWERWLGLRNLANTAFISFAYVNATTFTVNDNFTGARLVAVVGRKVRAIVTAGTVYGTITAASWATPNTTITVSWDSGSLDSGLSEVQFGPETRSIGGIQGNAVSATAPVTGQIWKHNGTQMAPSYPDGIVLLVNRTGVSLVPGDVVTVDPSNNTSVILADALATHKQLLISLDSPANSSSGRFATFGIGVVVNVTGTVTRGHYLVKSATTKVAADSGIAQGDTVNPPVGAFGIAMTADSAGQVTAWLFGNTTGITIGATPTTQDFADSATAGTSQVAAAADHLHGTPDLAVSRTALTTGDFSTSSTTFVNVTDLAATIVTGARRVRISLLFQITNATGNNRTITVNLLQDGSNIRGSGGVWRKTLSGNAEEVCELTILSDILTADSHTFQVQIANSQASAITVQANTTFEASIEVEEIPSKN